MRVRDQRKKGTTSCSLVLCRMIKGRLNTRHASQNTLRPHVENTKGRQGHELEEIKQVCHGPHFKEYLIAKMASCACNHKLTAAAWASTTRFIATGKIRGRSIVRVMSATLLFRNRGWPIQFSPCKAASCASTACKSHGVATRLNNGLP